MGATPPSSRPLKAEPPRHVIAAPTLLGLAAILLWSTTLPVARSLAEQIGALTAAACVNGIGGLLLLILSWMRRTKERGTFSRRYLGICGGLYVLYFALLHAGLGMATTRHQALEVGLMNYLWPSLTLLLAVPILGMPARWQLLLPGIAIAPLGVGMVLTSSTELTLAGFLSGVATCPHPYLLGTLAALAWALFSNLSRRLTQRATGSAISWFMLATGIVLWAMQRLFAETHLWTGRTVVEIAAMALISTTGYAFWDVAMRRGDIALVATFSYFTPLLSTLFGSFYLQVSPHPRLWWGCALIILAALICRLATQPRDDLGAVE